MNMKESDVETAITRLTESSENIADEMETLSNHIDDLTDQMDTVANEFAEFSRAGLNVNSHTTTSTGATYNHGTVADD